MKEKKLSDVEVVADILRKYRIDRWLIISPIAHTIVRVLRRSGDTARLDWLLDQLPMPQRGILKDGLIAKQNGREVIDAAMKSGGRKG